MATPSDIFGPIFVIAQLEQAVIELLQTWFPRYLREIEYQLDRPLGQIVAPTYYSTSNSFRSVEGEPNPRVAVISRGRIGPLTRSDDYFRGTFDLGIGIAYSNDDEAVSNLVSKIYAAAVEKIILDRASELGVVYDLTPNGVRIDDIELANRAQYYKSASIYFLITMDEIYEWGVRPDSPTIETPPEDWGEVESVDVRLTKEAI